MRDTKVRRIAGTGLFVAAMLSSSSSAAQTPYSDTARVYYRTYSAARPVLQRIRPSDTVATKTLDSGGLDEAGVQRGPTGNPLTGPFFVENAQPGDALAIRLLKVKLNRRSGYTAYRLVLPSLTPESIQDLYPEVYKDGLVCSGCPDLVPWDIDLQRKTVRLREPVSAVLPLEFPARPSVGSIGVAPRGDFAPAATDAGSFGGNLDYNELGEGIVLMLPVYHEGAFLYLGDGHALHADGEPIGGVETSLDVEFTVDVIKRAHLTGPRVETADYLITIGAQTEFVSSLDRALQLATSDMARWLVELYKVEPWAAHLLIGAAGEYRIVTVAGTVALKIPRKYLPRRQSTTAAEAQPQRDAAANRYDRRCAFSGCVSHVQQLGEAVLGENRIVFDTNRDGHMEVYVMDPDGTNQRRLTHTSGGEHKHSWMPSWSPDRKNIVFRSNRDGKWEIYRMRADGSHVRQLTHTPGESRENGNPAWSPDGKKIAFDSDRDGKWEIYLMNPDGSDVRQLTHTSADGLESGNPDWSADGKEIAFAAGKSPDWGESEIFLMDATGSGIRQLTHTPGKGNWDPRWAPDKKRIVFASNRNATRIIPPDADIEVYVMDADGSNVRQLTFHGTGSRPNWSPDGKKIVFMSTRDCTAATVKECQFQAELYVMEADGSNMKRLTRNQYHDGHPAW